MRNSKREIRNMKRHLVPVIEDGHDESCPYKGGGNCGVLASGIVS
jgi:hypothetical protein